MLDERRLQVALLVAAVASLIVLLGLFSDLFRIGCLVIITGAAVITAPARRERGGGWWGLLALGALGSIVGAIVAQSADTLGGLIAVVAGILVIVAATIGFPVSEEEG